MRKGLTVFMIFEMLDKKSLFVYAGDAENEEQARQRDHHQEEEK